MAARAVGGDAAIHSAIGAAIHDYASVEGAQVDLIVKLLSVDIIQASTIFHSVQNVRARNDMIAHLVSHKYEHAFDKYWTGCAKFLSNLASFRNAIVHWHPFVSLYVNPTTGELVPVNSIGNPKYAKGNVPLELADLSPFGHDCGYIKNILVEFAAFLPTFKPGVALPDKYRRPTIRPNKAVLRRQIPKK